MPEPIEYSVIRHLQAAIAAIAVSGGYYYDVANTAVKLDPNHQVEDLVAPTGPRPFVFIVVDPEKWSYPEMPMGLRIVMPVTVVWVHEQDLSVDEDKNRVFFRGCADIEKAIAADISRGGMALMTLIKGRSLPAEPEGALVRAVIDVEITVRREYGVPSA